MSRKKSTVKTITPVATKQVQAVEPVATNPMQAAIQSGASPTELLQFMELQERWEANEARKAYVSAMAEFRAECPVILKTKKAHNSTYAGMAGTMEQIKSIMSKNGLSHSWRTKQDNGLITVTCIITHTLGHSESTTLSGAPDKTGSKNDIQAIGSTVKYLERYTLEASLGLVSDDPMDDDGNAAGQQVERISEDQALTIHSMIVENEIPMSGFMNWLKAQMRVDSIDDINVNSYPVVIERIQSAIDDKKDANN